jgi:hypothetical protein
MTEEIMQSEIGGESPMAQEDATCAPTEAQSEDMSLAVLIAMVPLMVFTLFGQVGLL